jgi:hypothetical protein
VSVKRTCKPFRLPLGLFFGEMAAWRSASVDVCSCDESTAPTAAGRVADAVSSLASRGGAGGGGTFNGGVADGTYGGGAGLADGVVGENVELSDRWRNASTSGFGPAATFLSFGPNSFPISLFLLDVFSSICDGGIPLSIVSLGAR